MKPIAICQNKKVFDHSTLWTRRFIDYCQQQSIPYDIIDCYNYDVISNLNRYSALVWHYENIVLADVLEARNIIHAANNMGLETFPYPEMNWHFDDKIAEMYALQSVNAVIPKSWVFYLEDDCLDWLSNEAKYPLVAKLRCGSGSNNVCLLKNKDDAIKYAHKMFSRGISPTPNLAYKAFSKIQSSKNIRMFVNRAKRIPEFLRSRKQGKMMPAEKGYCYFQEYIPNEGYDLKVVVIGEKITFCARNTRKNDFRASGGGSVYYDRELLTDSIVDSAFETAKKLNMFCVGFDYVVDRTTGNGKIIEMCYGFDYEVQKELGAYIDKNHVWHEESVYIPDDIIKMIAKKVKDNE